MKHIAVLLTCFNRKEKTLNALTHVYRSHNPYKDSIALDVILTDDGSTDGTAEAVKSKFKDVKILMGDGDLFWANGMNNSWSHALDKKRYDGFLLLNDDTNVFGNLFEQLEKTSDYCLKHYHKGGVYIGSTKDPKTGQLTYGGARITSSFKYTFKKIIPGGKPQECDLGNANIMFVTKEAVKIIGILSKGYRHGVADYDYTLKCKKNNIPVLVMPEICGECEFDHKDMYHNFTKKTLKQRIDYLYHPLGIDFKSRALFMRKFFLLRYPIFLAMGYFKVLFPGFYTKYLTNR